jgi:ceramide glucosyltransferase
MQLLAWFAVACAGFGGIYQIFQCFAAWRFFHRAARTFRLPAPGVALPPVTLLKPLRGPGIDLYENLESFCRQDYPAYQIVFGVEDPNDPAAAIVQQIRRDFPNHDIVLSVGDRPGTNRKIANLRHMMRHARHDVLVMSDADIRVRPDYIRTMVAPFVDPAAGPRVGLTTCLYRGVGHFGLPSVLESLFINTDFFPMVLTAQLVDEFEYAYGASIGFRREALDQIGGFEGIADYLADDFLIGYRIAKAGWGLVLVPYTVETVLDSRTLGDVWRHLLRWSRTNRAARPASWFFVVLTHATLWGCLALLATGGSPLGWAAFAWALGCRLLGIAIVLTRLGEHETLRHLWLVPLKDLCHSLLWVVTFLGDRVTWSGQEFRVLPGGRLVPLQPATTLVAAAPAASAAGRGYGKHDHGAGAPLSP